MPKEKRSASANLPVASSSKRRALEQKRVLMKSMLKKDAAVIHMEGSLSLLERKLYNVLLLNAFDRLEQDQIHALPTWVLCDLIGFNSHDIKHLQESLKTLMSTVFELNLLRDGKREWKASSLLAYAEIVGGVCKYAYSPLMAQWLKNPEVYTQVNFSVLNQFSSAYTAALYENCLRFRAVGKTRDLEVDLLRMLMGAHKDASYQEFKEFKRRVLDVAVSEINRCSDIYVEPIYTKTGRKITSVSFVVKKNPQRHIAVVDTQCRDDDPLLQQLLRYQVPRHLAEVYVHQYPQRVRRALQIVQEEQQRRPGFMRRPEAYVRALIESGVDMSEPVEQVLQQAAPVAEETLKVQQHNEQQRQREQRYQAKLKEAISMLTREQIDDLMQRFEQMTRRKIRRAEDGYPIDALDRNTFMIWLRGQIKVEVEDDQ